MSSDISSMFSYIPTDECLFLISYFPDKTNVDIILNNEINDTFKLCNSQNYWQFYNKFHTNTHNTDLAMMSPLN